MPQRFSANGLNGPDTSSDRYQDAVSAAMSRVKTRRIKEFVTGNLPERSVLRSLLLEEKDEMDEFEFLVKMDVWLKLLRIESAQ